MTLLKQNQDIIVNGCDSTHTHHLNGDFAQGTHLGSAKSLRRHGLHANWKITQLFHTIPRNRIYNDIND